MHMCLYRVLMVEAYPETANQTQSLYMYNDKPGAHMPTNMALIDLDKNCDAECIRDKVDGYMDMTEGTDYWRNWQVGALVIVSTFHKCLTLIHVLSL